MGPEAAQTPLRFQPSRAISSFLHLCLRHRAQPALTTCKRRPQALRVSRSQRNTGFLPAPFRLGGTAGRLAGKSDSHLRSLQGVCTLSTLSKEREGRRTWKSLMDPVKSCLRLQEADPEGSAEGLVSD